MKKGLPCLPKVFHLDCKKALLDEKHGIRHLRYIQKNASENSRIEILFVTLFYCLYDICIRRTKPTVCLTRITFLAIMLTDNS